MPTRGTDSSASSAPTPGMKLGEGQGSRGTDSSASSAPTPGIKLGEGQRSGVQRTETGSIRSGPLQNERNFCASLL